MDHRRTKRSTVLFLLFLLLAGVANLLSATGNPLLDAGMACFNYLTCVGLLLFWIQSVRARLLPSRARVWVISAGLTMLLYQLLRIFKYRFLVDPVTIRYAVYLYCPLRTLIPAFFLMTCQRIRRGNRPGSWNEALLLVLPALLSLTALTNDLHFWVYRPRIDLSSFIVDSGTYATGPVLYLQYAWIILALLAGLVLLFRQAGRLHRKALLLLLAETSLCLALILIGELHLFPNRLRHMYNTPEILTFGMLGIVEICIRSRLIPNNENYPGFFRALRIPALVTDRQYQPVFQSGSPFSAAGDQLRLTISSPVYLSPDLRLSGREIRAGYAFWVEDEAAVHRAQDRLEEANDMIEHENSLIQAETAQKEKDAFLQSRHRIYHEIAEEIYPCQQRVAQLLDRMLPDSPAFRDQLAAVSVLNAYVKRKANLLLSTAEKELLTTRDLFIALSESAVYLTLAGLRTNTLQPEEKAFPAARIIALYDAFESVAEQLIGSASSLMVSWNDDVLTLATETDRIPDASGVPVPMRIRKEEEILFMDFFAKKGGEMA